VPPPALSLLHACRFSFLVDVNGHAVATVRSARWMTVKDQSCVSL
jgi:hypothetical protein